MGKPPHSQPEKPSHPAIQPRMVAPPPPPPIRWPQPAPHALQRKVAGDGQRTGAEAGPAAAPPVYWPRTAPHALQRKAAEEGPRNGAGPAAVQLSSVCNCNKPGNKHRSDCPANPKRKKAKAKVVKVVHQESQSIRNLYAYDSVWANQNAITEKMVKDFVKSYGVIHGHASSRADKDAKRHKNTTQDINAFHGWFNQNGHKYL